MKKPLNYGLLIAFIIVSKTVLAQVSIIPQPSDVVMPSIADSFAITPQTVIITGHAGLQPSVDFLNAYLEQLYGFTLKKKRKKPSFNVIYLRNKKEGGTVGSYTMEIKKESISIEGEEETGVFYGMQTLLQLLPIPNTGTALHVPAVCIRDSPRYTYRGLMLDVSRHFFPVEFVKRYIDYMALHKLNYLHWHLTDDQGWRIEIKKYPRLTQVGAWRHGTLIGKLPGTGNDNKPYGGFYTQHEIREIIQYALERYITIVPEIEMPGHASAAIASFPFLSCFPEEPTIIPGHPSLASQQTGGKKVQEAWGIHHDVFCAGNDSVFVFLQDVLDEVVALFPSRYIHIGGDECPKTNWKKCDRCQQRMKENNLKDEHELQGYFVKYIEKYISSKGRILLGWDDILEGGLADNAVVMSWRSEAGGIEAVSQKHHAIMTPHTYLYLDYYQGKPSQEPLAIGGYLTLEKIYSYDPTPASLSLAEATHIIGAQANLWTEYIATPEKAEYMTMPRLAALSEIAWALPDRKNWEGFKERMDKQYRRYDAQRINYAKSVYDVRQTIVLEGSRATVTLTADIHAPEIYYTLDGSEPNLMSKRYTKPFDIHRSATIKAATFINNKQAGKTSVQEVVIH